jgi:O-antigen/teichoic acid export membrane protein
MRHPLRRMATQGAWYAFGNALAKLSGFILLPVLTNTAYLPMADYGRWGVYEVTVQLAVAILGLSLGIGLVRFYNDPETGGAPAVSAAWWTTVAIGAAATILASAAIRLWAPLEQRAIQQWILAYIIFELLLAIPLALLRAREQAGSHTWLQGIKLGLLVAFGLLFLAARRMGLLGLARAFAAASGITLLLALIWIKRSEFFLPRIPRAVTRTVLLFSVPLVVGGLGSMVLNAGDRYVLAHFRPSEQVALYTLAGKFGGVVNMFVVQPLNLAWLPLLFRMEERQRPEVLRLLVPYLAFTLCLAAVALSVLAGPALILMGSAPSYRQAAPLVPWVAFGFAAYGLATVFGGIIALYKKTRVLSLWLLAAAAANIGLNFLLIPRLGPLGAAINTLIAYLVLLGGQYYSARRMLPNRYPWARLAGLAAISLAASLAGALVPAGNSAGDWLFRTGLLAGWLVILLLTRWFTIEEFRRAWRALRGPKSASAAAQAD